MQGGAQQNTAYSVFDVSVILSNDGLTHWADVVALVFKYSAACNALTRQTPCSMSHAAKPCKMQRNNMRQLSRPCILCRYFALLRETAPQEWVYNEIKEVRPALG